MESVISSLPAFLLGLVVGVVAMAVFNKLRGGAANPATTKDAFDQYKADVAEHFTETGKKFQSMASQYQDLYEHLAVGAHTLLDNETANKMLAPPEQSKSSDKLNDSTGTKRDAPAKVQVKASGAGTSTKSTGSGLANKDDSSARSSKDKSGKVSGPGSAKTTESKPAQNHGKKK